MLRNSVFPGVRPGNALRRHRQIAAAARVRQFVFSKSFILLIGAIAASANLLSLELAAYTVYIGFAVYIAVFGQDFLPLVPIVIFAYITPSADSNPGRNAASVFYPANGGTYLICLLALFAGSVVIRLWMDPELGGKRFLRAKRKLLPGMLALGAAYMLSGIGSQGYSDNGAKNLIFGFIQFLSVFLLYFLLTGGVKWEKVSRDYFAWTGVAVGLVLLTQIGGIYLNGNLFADGSILRSRIFTGWGMYNNIGALLAMMVPFPFYFACRRQRGWRYVLLGSAFLLGVVLTCSRGSILGAGVAYCVSFLIALRYGKNKRTNCAAFLGVCISAVACLLAFHGELGTIFRDMLSKRLNPQSRDVFFVEGIRQFLKYPVFGGSFYPIDFVPWDWSSLEAFSSVFPPRWHNTVIQLLAGCGIVGILAYGVHRLQTLKLFLRAPSLQKTFIGLSLLVLLGTSLLDCHFFNVGPTLFYSMALAFAEKGIGTEKIE